jgi:hypothetical protein
LHYCGKAKQHHEYFKQIPKPGIAHAHKLIDQIKANCADNDDDEHEYEREKQQAPMSQ